MKKLILTESDKKQILAQKEKAILESFANTFNKIKRIDENELKEYDNYNYPAGADADPNAPWNQDDYETQYEYRNGELDDVNVLDKNYSGPIENQKLELRSTDGGTCIVTMGQIFKELNVPQNIIEKIKANNTTHQDFLTATEIKNQTGKYPEEYLQKVGIYNDIFDPIIDKYGNEIAEYEHEIEPEEYERDDYDRDDYDDRDYDREYGGIDENALTENNESTVLTSTDKNDLKQDIAKLKKEKPDAKVGEITKNGKTFSVRITF
jgi:hypothetical protein